MQPIGKISGKQFRIAIAGNKEQENVPAIVTRSMAVGMLLMALFTMMWSGIAESGLNGRGYGLIIITFSIFSGVFIVYAIYLFIVANRFPPLHTAAQKREGKKIGKWYGILFGSECIAIVAMCSLCSALHYSQFIIPGIALIVGLHFYPMAKIFRREIDYYFATWTCIIAICGMAMTGLQLTSEPVSRIFVGIGVAMTTTGYGIYMLHAGNQYLKANQSE